MAELNKDLAKLHLEQKGLLTALDVQLEEEGFEAPGFDLLGVEIVRGMVSQAVVGVVRGWWHSGAYLTPATIRFHLEGDRRQLSEAFSQERIGYIRKKFGLGAAPIHNYLFYSMRSPVKSEEAEKILATMDIRVVYLEDIILDILPKVGKSTLGDGAVGQLLPVVRFSRLFRDLRDAIRKADACAKEPGEGPGTEKARKKRGASDMQMDFLKQLFKYEAGDGAEPEE